MAALQEGLRIRISARELAVFSFPNWESCRRLPGEAPDGQLEQEKLQQQRPAHYRPEVTLSQTFERVGFLVELGGRADGLYEGPSPVLEEIKTTRRHLSELISTPEPAHWAQLEVYGYLLCRERGLSECTLHLTYLLTPSGVVQVLVRRASFQQLEVTVLDLLDRYLLWQSALREWRSRRDEVLAGSVFPFPRRPGQEEIERWVEEACRQPGLRLLEAPTGTGKTLSALFSGLRQLGLGGADQVGYACPRSTGRGRALEAVQTLGLAGTCKTVIVSGRERICDGRNCGRIPGRQDLLDLRMQFFEHSSFDTELLQQLGARWGVCPYRLGLEWARWADLVIADFHYWLGPGGIGLRAELPRRRCLLLIDEAHQLGDRARSFFSARLDLTRLSVLQSACRGLPSEAVVPRVDYLAAEEAQPWLLGESPPGPLLHGLQRLHDQIAELPLTELAALDPELRETCFELGRFLDLAGQGGAGFACWRSGGLRPELSLDCLDPLPGLRKVLAGHAGCVLFSATLQADPVLADLLAGAGGDWTSLDSIFPQRHFQVLCASRLDTRFRVRRRLLGQVASWVQAFCEAVPGHSILYFPSYQLLRETLSVLFSKDALGERQVLVESPGLSDSERNSWRERFRSPEPCLGLCVLGGSFAEAIDIPGGFLKGIGILGPGLPSPSFQRNLMFEYFEERGSSGFERAYRLPGIQKVIQAAGRLIRSAEDRGTLVLFGKRFQEPGYRRLLPSHWRIEEVSRPPDLRRAVETFWGSR